MKIKISKSQWEEAGKKAGWMKTAQEYGYDEVNTIVDMAVRNPSLFKSVLKDNPEICDNLYSLISSQQEGINRPSNHGILDLDIEDLQRKHSMPTNLSEASNKNATNKTALIKDDGYADGGEPYTDEEMDLMEKSAPKINNLVSIFDLVSDWEKEGYGIALVDAETNRVVEPYVDPSDFPTLEFNKSGDGVKSTDGKYYIRFHSGILESDPEYLQKKISKITGCIIKTAQMRETYNPKLTTDEAKSLWFKLNDYLIMADDPKYETIKRFRNAIEKIKDLNDKQEMKKYFESEFSGSHTEKTGAWEYYK